MCLKPQTIRDVLLEMVRVVRAVFPKDNIYIHLRDTLGTIYQDELFADVYPKRGQPAYAPWCLALVTVFHFMKNLTDRQAADAVRSRLDWKYALSLELIDPGFDHTVLSISKHDENSRQKGDGHGNICAGAWSMVWGLVLAEGHPSLKSCWP
ncbi:MAG: hypothetical protein NVSMB38_09410 [Ktedonobacteraceae bacterium]